MGRRKKHKLVPWLLLMALLVLAQPAMLTVKPTTASSLQSQPETPTPPPVTPARPDSPADAPTRPASEITTQAGETILIPQLPTVKFRVENGYDLDQYLFAESGPLDFNIDLQGFKPPSSTPARLTMRMWDVDEVGQADLPECLVEVNQVYVNGVYLADLEDTGEQWSIITLAVPPELLQEGLNHFWVEIDVLTQACWAIEIDWAELEISFNIAQTKASALNDVTIKRGKTNQVITDPIWQTSFDNNGQIISPATPDDPIADKSEGGAGEFKYKYQLDTWPADAQPGWTPSVEYAWEIQDSDQNSGGFHSQTGWQNEFTVTLPDEVGTYTLNVILKIYHESDLLRTENRSHKLYILLNSPITSITVSGGSKIATGQPRTAWLDIATDWASGEQTAVGVLQALNLREYGDSTNPLGWGYGYPKVSPVTLIENGAGKNGDCYVFRDVWRILAATLGINTGSTQYRPSTRFMTLTRPALDGNASANAWNTTSDNRDRWNFNNHQYGLYGSTFYDPTFGLTGPNTTAGKEANVFCKVSGTQNGRQVCKVLASSSTKALITPTSNKLNGWTLYKYEIINLLLSTPGIDTAALVTARSNHGGFSGNFSHQGYDGDGNGLFEHLQVDVEVDMLQAGNFAFMATLTTARGDLITTGSLKPNLNRADLVTSITLESGRQIVPIYLNGHDIRAFGGHGPYTLSLGLSNEAGDLLDIADFIVDPYNPLDFQGLLVEVRHVRDRGVNVEAGPGYNLLRVAAQINMLATEQVTIQGQLFAGDTFLADVTITDKLTAGPHLLKLDFPGTAIATSGLDGPYTVYLSFNDPYYSSTIMHITNAYNSAQFQPPAAFFTRRIRDNGYAPNGNNLYSELRIVAELAAAIPAIYTVHAVLQDNRGIFIDATKTTLALDSIPGEAILSFDGLAINRSGADGPYQATLALLDPNGVQLMRLNYITGVYSYTEFQHAGARFDHHFTDKGTDPDRDGFYNQLQVNVGVMVREANMYTLASSLHDSQGNFITTAQTEVFLNVGSNTVPLNFDGTTIYTQGLNGPYQLRALKLSRTGMETEDNLLEAYATQAYVYTDFQPASLLINSSFADHGEDTNGNGLFDALVVDMKLLITQSDTYFFNAHLVDAMGKEIEWTSNTQSLTAGIQSVSLRFKGQYIYGYGADGPYQIKDLSIYSDSQSSTLVDVYTTKAYNWRAFEPSGIVSGTVTVNGEAVPNANIFISGFDRDLTDSKGIYKLTVPGATDSYVIHIHAAAQPMPWQIWVNGIQAATLGTSAIIKVGAGERVEVNFVSPAGAQPSLFLPIIIKNFDGSSTP